MLGTIITKEIRENIGSYKFLVIFLLLTALFGTSFFVMYKDFRLRQENYEILRPQTNQPIAIIPPNPMSIFVKGLDESMGRSFEVRFGGQIRVGSKQQSINSLFRLFTTPDPLFVIKIVSALCALLFAFDMISGEKESRTLALSLSNPVRRSTVLLGKWIGGFVSFIVPFITLFLAGAVLVSLSSHVQWGLDGWIRIGALLFFSICYLAYFFTLGMLVSTLTHEPASSLVVSLFFWALLIFIIPNLGNTLARQLIKVQSVEQLEMKRIHNWVKEVFVMNNERSNSGNTVEKYQALINNGNDRLIEEYRGQFSRLVSLSKAISRVSPAAAFTYLSTDITGTGLREEARLKETVVRYKNTVWNKPTDSDGNITGEFSPFTFDREKITQSMSGDNLINITIILLYLILAFAGSWAAFILYDVR